MTVSERLKTSTRPLHDSAESNNFQRLLSSGLLAIPAYSAYLEQLFLVHQRLESEIKTHAESYPRLQEIVSAEQMQEAFLRDDLQFLDVDPTNVTSLPQTANLLNQISLAAQNNPVALLGFHYVLLGSKHGGKFIAHNVKQKYGFDGRGAKYFDPYAGTFMQHWRIFIDGVNQSNFTEADINSLLDGAKAMFLAINEIGSALDTKFKTTP